MFLFLQEQLMESMALLQEATDILNIEPYMKETLETKVQDLKAMLDLTTSQ